MSHLETDLKKTLNECVESGETVVVEMPNQRLLAILSLDPRRATTSWRNSCFQSKVLGIGSKIESRPAQAVHQGKQELTNG